MIKKVYMFIRYIAIMLLVFMIVGVYKIEPIGWWIVFYYIAVNYLALKYGIANYANKNRILKQNYVLPLAIMVVMFNAFLYLILGFVWNEIIVLSIIPVVELFFIKDNTDKEQLMKRAIDEYFNNRKED